MNVIRLFNILLLIVFIFSLVACSSDMTDDSQVAQLEEKLDQLMEQNEKLASKLDEQQKFIKSVLDTEMKQIIQMLENTGLVYIKKKEALEIAKKMTNGDDTKIQWLVEFNNSYPINPDKPELKRPVWIVKATHPAGNRTIYYIDAITKGPEIVSEIEAPHVGAKTKNRKE